MKRESKFANTYSFSFITACSIGTILEWYDFTLYAYLTPIISKHYFPSDNLLISTMLAYSIFAVGFLVRPIGGVFFGHFGDRIGRKKVLISTLSLMSAMTFLIGLLPTYNQIGLLAPIVLLILRIFQGLAIGGETLGAGSLIIESAQNNKRGFSTSLIWASSGLGILLSSIIISITTRLFSQNIFFEWAWRIPFLLGIFTGIAGYYLRKNISESFLFVLIQKRNEIARIPLMKALHDFKKEIFIAIGLYVLCAITTYLLFVFMPVYATKTIGLPFNQVMTINTATMALMIFLVPLVGRFSDIFGRKIFLLISAIGFLVMSYPLYGMISGNTLSGLIIAQVIFAILTAGFQGSVTSAVLEMFPSKVRYTAAALGYNLSYSIFGGITPLIALFLVNQLHSNLAPSFYLIFGSIIAIFSIMNMNETYKAQLT